MRPLSPLLIAAVAVVVACGADAPPPATDDPLAGLVVDRGRLSVSGLSAGGYMAGQMHVAHSALFAGSGILAAGPYGCARGDLTRALGPCISGESIPVDELLALAGDQAQAGGIDPLAGLAGDRVWLFHGGNDAAVGAGVSVAAAAFFRSLAGESAVALVDDVPAVHGMPTLDAGAPCGEFTEPYVNDCDYDAAGALLAHLHGPLAARATDAAAPQRFDQTRFGEDTLADVGLVYVPESCSGGEPCGVHVVFHGCKQGEEFVGDAFARLAGYNEWARANRLVVLYPQVRASKFAPLNPLGCWDWWGYTGEEYATRAGPQIAAVRGMLAVLMGETKD